MDNPYRLKRQVEEILFKVNSENAVIFNSRTDDFLTPNYTINCFFKESDLENIHLMIERLGQKGSKQLFYTPRQLHITLLGQIDLNSDKNRIIKTVQNFLNQNKIIFHLLGVGSSKKVASVTAFPINFQIEELRSELRKIGGGTTFDGPYEKLAWINFMRYLIRPENELFDTLRSEIDTDFGTVKPKKIQLLKNSSRLLEDYEVIHNFII